METLTEQKIIEVIDEYKSALLEKNKAKKLVDKAQIEMQKAQKRVSMAFDSVNSLRLRN